MSSIRMNYMPAHKAALLRMLISEALYGNPDRLGLLEQDKEDLKDIHTELTLKLQYATRDMSPKAIP